MILHFYIFYIILIHQFKLVFTLYENQKRKKKHSNFDAKTKSSTHLIASLLLRYRENSFEQDIIIFQSSPYYYAESLVVFCRNRIQMKLTSIIVYLLFQIFFNHLKRTWLSQYKHSNIKIPVLKYEKNMSKTCQKRSIYW